MAKVINVYDENENLVTMFENSKECAEYFGSTVKSIDCFISRKQTKYLNGKKYFLERVEINEKEDYEND